jgi:hypothetical protein
MKAFVLGGWLLTSAAVSADSLLRFPADAELPPALAARAIDYPHARYLALREAERAQLSDAIQPISVTLDAFALSLPGYHDDPLRAPPIGSSRTTAGTGFALVQFVGPIKSEWREDLVASGATIVDALAPFGYLVYANQASTEAISALPFVRWTGALASAHRQSERILAPLPAHVRLVALRNHSVSAERLDQLSIKELARAPIDATWEIILIDPRARSLDDLLALPGVLTVESIPEGSLRGELSSQINVGGFNPSGVPIPGYRAWLSARNLRWCRVLARRVQPPALRTAPTPPGSSAATAPATCSMQTVFCAASASRPASA